MKDVVLHSSGSAGPSGLDADCWRRLCSSFKGASSALCRALAGLARLLATVVVGPLGLAPFLACRLIALNKRPGVRPIGVGEVLRRVVAKSILRVVAGEVEDACGPLQKCSGLPAGIEAAVHAMQNIYSRESTEGVLLIDARNAFNSLNRRVALHNVHVQCPSLAKILLNSYGSPARLFVAGGGELASQEGTTQGDPLSMAFYAMATIPLVDHLQAEHPSVDQGWYANDSGSAGRMKALRQWYDTIDEVGRSYGYFVNSNKSVLLVKSTQLQEAYAQFDGTGVQIVTGGVRYLGSAIGEAEYRAAFVADKVDEWRQELDRLATFAGTEPHSAFAALTHGLRGRWTFVLRTIPVAASSLDALDGVLVGKFLPAISLRRAFSEEDLQLLRLPARLGGIGLPHLSVMASVEYAASLEVTERQVAALMDQNVSGTSPFNAAAVHREAMNRKNAIWRGRRRREAESYNTLLSSAPTPQRLELLCAKGASAWLTALPLKEFGFHLVKRDFRDALCMRYGWNLESLPTKCACSKPFTIDHAMVCSTGRFPQ